VSGSIYVTDWHNQRIEKFSPVATVPLATPPIRAVVAAVLLAGALARLRRVTPNRV